MMPAMRLSAVIIARNEHELLAQALASVKGFDEIIVVDTGSTDDTVKIAEAAGARVFHYPWRDDFAAARNFAIDCATGDWCLTVDADWRLATPVEYVRADVARLDAAGVKVAAVKAVHHGGLEHWGAWLYRNDPAIRWVGRVHEVLNHAAQQQSGVVMEIGNSPTKATDPERNLRILRASDPDSPRTQFYLGRELFERGKHDEAIEWLRRFLGKATWLPEIAEAHLTIAKCFWRSGRGDEARSACLEAIRQNPDFKEALLLMAEMYFEPWKSKWKRLATVATNDDVLFVRAA